MARPDTSFHGSLRCLQDGALGGMAGGVLFAAILALSGGLSSLADIVGPPHPLLGLALVMALGLATGVLFATLVRGRLRSSAGYAAAGLLLGAVVWTVAVLVVLPRVAGAGLGHPWSVDSAGDAVPSLLGHLVLGLTTGRAFDWLQCRGCEG